ncbi:MAG: riboflavin synthase [Acidimicrobiales bacterium]
MFTGIIQAQGSVISLIDHRLVLGWPTMPRDLSLGASVAVNGVCLTVVALEEDRFGVDVVDETFARSNLGALKVGDVVNLERPVAAQALLDGHIVQGHVDSIGTVRSVAPEMRVEPRDPELLRYVVEKGSVAIDGVSLTVVDVDETGFGIAVIPHTAAVTTLGIRQVGDAVNLEFDVIAKYVERLVVVRR